LLLLAAILVSAGCEPSAGNASPPDVVLIVLDTLRPDHLELFGYDVETAPFLSELGERGAVFERAFSTSAWTPPATASLITGLYPQRHGVVNGFELEGSAVQQIEQGGVASVSVSPLPASHATLAERFSRAGYTTIGVTTNVHINEIVGHDRGFDRFTLERYADAARVAELLTESLAEAPEDRPRFLYLHLMDVHKPFHEREPWYSEYSAHSQRSGRLGKLVTAYDSEISFADAQLRDMYERFGWAENTVLCVVSDHGEGFGEGGLVGHGPSLSWVVNRCLLLLSGSGVARMRVESNVSLVDVVPTLLELTGQVAPADLDGRSLLPLLDPTQRPVAEAGSAERALFAHRRHRRQLKGSFLWSVVQGRWKLVHDEFSGVSQLFDMAVDPFEEFDLSEAQPERLLQLRALHETHVSGAAAAGQAEQQVDIDAEMYAHLQALGYAGDDDH
jgi:arylsulfatase A-like enzyme